MADGYISILLAGEVSPYERLSMKSFVDMTGLIDAYGLSSGIFAPGVSYPISSADALHLLIPSRDLQQSMLEAAHEDIEFLRRRYLGAMGETGDLRRDRWAYANGAGHPWVNAKRPFGEPFQFLTMVPNGYPCARASTSSPTTDPRSGC